MKPSKLWKFKSNAQKEYIVSEEDFDKAYRKYSGNYAKIEKDILGISMKGRKLFYIVQDSSWWSKEKYPRKGSSKKYHISEQDFVAAYEAYPGNYSAIEKELINVNSNGNRIIPILMRLDWWSKEKYPSRGIQKANRKYYISEEEFAEAYSKYPGNYADIERELIGRGIGGSTILQSVEKLPWWSKEKYPRHNLQEAHRKYNVSEKEFAEAYSKYPGNYADIERELIGRSFGGITIIRSVQNLTWWSKEKYPRNKIGTSHRKYNIEEKEFSSAHSRFKGDYSAMSKELIGHSREGGRGLFRSVQNLPWFSIEKYPRKKREKSLTPKKKLNRGQYQNAVSMALASKIGMSVPVAESDKEISSDADLLLKDINDLASEGMSIDQIAEELNIERAIVKRALESKVKPNPKRRYNPEGFDEARFRQLVKRFLKEEYTEAQAQYLAYKDMGEPIPEKIKKKVRDEEITLDMVGSHLPLKAKKKVNPKRKSNPIIIDALSKTDFIVRRTEDGKFFVIRKVRGGYTLAGSKRDEDGEYVINSYSVSKFKNKKAAIEKATEALRRKSNPGKICEQCEKREATTKFRSIMVCDKCEDILSGEEKEYRGSDIEEYEEYDDEGNIIPRKENPTQFHGTIKEIDEDIKKQIIEMYKSGDTIIRIAKVVHLNSTLVKEVLAEASVPVRKGGHKERIKSNPRPGKSSFRSLVKDMVPGKVKRKSNPDFDADKFMTEAIKNIPQMWIKLREHKYGSDEFNRLVKIIMWGQGVFLDWVSNSYVTVIMINGLYDSFGIVEKDPTKFFKNAIFMTLFKRSEADKIIEKLNPKSFGAKSVAFFDKTKAADKKLYFSFMEERLEEFSSSFSIMKADMRIVDFVNFLREFSTTRYSEKHEVLIRELSLRILRRPVGEELLPEEIDKAKSLLNDVHIKAMEIITRSKIFLREYVKGSSNGEGNRDGKA